MSIMGRPAGSAHIIVIGLIVTWIYRNAVQSSGTSACGGCHKNEPPYPSHTYKGGLSDAEKTFRIDLVKLKILNALGMSKPPDEVPPIHTIGLPYDIKTVDAPFYQEPMETESPKEFLVGRKVADGCPWNQSALCVYFQDEGRGRCKTKSEQLWIYMNSNITGDISVYGNDSNGFHHRINRNGTGTDTWVTMPLPPRIGQAHGRNISFLFYQDHETTQQNDYFYTEIPLIEVTSENCSTPQRRKRSVRTQQCPTVSSGDNEPECCLQQFVVNVSAIGWNDFIRAPATFSANYCRGICNLQVLTRGYDHSSMMMIYSQRLDMDHMVPCCAPVQKSALQAYVYNKTSRVITLQMVPGISATACGCL